jgi:SAM-dependent MidA family methyltransferase
MQSNITNFTTRVSPEKLLSGPEIARTESLRAGIASAIRGSGGSISFGRQFVPMAMYGHGGVDGFYTREGFRPNGGEGSFGTASSFDTFGALIGEILAFHADSSELTVIEHGGGDARLRGSAVASIIASMANFGAPLTRLNYIMRDISPELLGASLHAEGELLRILAEVALSECGHYVPEVTLDYQIENAANIARAHKLRGVVYLSVELLDMLPFAEVKCAFGAWSERVVTTNRRGVLRSEWRAVAADTELSDFLAEWYGELSSTPGSITVQPGIISYLGSSIANIEQGAVLAVDYLPDDVREVSSPNRRAPRYFRDRLGVILDEDILRFPGAFDIAVAPDWGLVEEYIRRNKGVLAPDSMVGGLHEIVDLELAYDLMVEEVRARRSPYRAEELLGLVLAHKYAYLRVGE